MTRNIGQTSLKSKRRCAHPMSEYDRLPANLRSWVARAVLPWRAQSVRLAYDRALARTGTVERALRELDSIQARLIAKDSALVWGPEHPQATADAKTQSHLGAS